MYNVFMEYKSNNNVVWCPKYRRKVLINGVDVRLKELIKQTASELHADIIEMEVMPDHVHVVAARKNPLPLGMGSVKRKNLKR